MVAIRKEPEWLQEQYNGNGHQSKLPAKQEEVIPPLKTFSIGELLNKEFEPLKWIIPDILPEGLTLLFSRPKVGKSMMALALSLRIARRMSGGVDGDVLYLTLDDTSQRRLQDRSRSLLQGLPVKEKLWFSTESRSLDNGLIDQLGYWMHDHPTTCLMVIDVFGAVKPKRQSSDIYQNDYQALKSLREFAERHHLAILLVHHTRKQTDTEDWINNINGSTGLPGACDTIWMLKRRRGSQAIELSITGRDVEDCTVGLSLDDLDAPWTVEGQESDRDINDSEYKVLVVLQGAKEGLSPKKVAEMTGLKAVTARVTIRRMLTKNLVTQSTYGLYELAARVTESYRVTESQSVCNSSNSSQPASQATLDSIELQSYRVTEKEKSCNSVTLAVAEPVEPIRDTLKSYSESFVTVEQPATKPRCQDWRCLLGPNRVTWTRFGFYCSSHHDYVDSEGRPL